MVGRNFDVGGANPPKRGLGSLIKKVAAIGIVAAGVGSCGYFATTEYVRPGEYGVRKNLLVGQRGWVDKTLEPGRHISIPGVSTVHRMPSEEQVVTMKGTGSEADREKEQFAQVLPAVRIETSDLYYVDTDVTINYQITNPFLTVSEFGAGRQYLDQMATAVPAAIKAEFGSLQPEDFFNVPRYQEEQVNTRDRLNGELAQYGITVNKVMLRFPTLHNEIQTRIEETKVNDQLVFTNIWLDSAASAKASLDSVEQVGVQDSLSRQQEGDAYFRQRMGADSAYVRTRNAAGQLLIRNAQAASSRLINNALQGAGSELLVCKDWAESTLGNLQYILLQPGGTNPLNLQQTLAMCTGGNE